MRWLQRMIERFQHKPKPAQRHAPSPAAARALSKAQAQAKRVGTVLAAHDDLLRKVQGQWTR